MLLNSSMENLPSINLLYDSTEPIAQLNHFYLTKKGASVIQTVFHSLSAEKHKRMATITAPPGSGKSYLALFLGTALLKNPIYTNHILKILSTQNKIRSEEVLSLYQEYIQSEERIIPIYLLGEVSSLKHSILSNLLTTISALLLGNKQWEQFLYKDFPKKLGMSNTLGDSNIIDSIANYIVANNFIEGYSSLIQYIRNFGYTGVAFFHDEFNRFLLKEQNEGSNELNFLQDFAEYNLRLKKQKVFYYLLTHKGISQYLKEISEDRKKEWLKIEGRFYPIYFQEEMEDVYGFISHYIQKSSLGNSNMDSVHSEIQTAFEINPHLSLELGEPLKEISYQAYPLHITTLLSLPLLSFIFGQNERTLLGYLQDMSYRNKNDKYIRMDDLFDYFDPSIDKFRMEESIITKWNYGRNALNESTTKEEDHVIKILTLLTILSKQNLLPASLGWISFSVGYTKQETESILKSLEKRNLVLYREVNDTYQIHYGSSINISEKVTEMKTSVTAEEMQKTLDTNFTFVPIYGTEFNAKYYTSRFYSRRFLLEEYLQDYSIYKFNELGLKKSEEKINKKEEQLFIQLLHNILREEKQNGSSGIIFYYLGSAQSRFKEIFTNAISKDPILGKQVVFLFPESTFFQTELIKKFCAAEKISQVQQYSKDPKVKADVNIYQNDIYEKLHFIFSTYFLPDSTEMKLSLEFPKPTKGIPLDELVSTLLEKRYTLTPKINSEFINREHISPIIRNSRKKLIRQMLSGSFYDKHIGLTGYGPDVTIFRNIFYSKSIYKLNEKVYSFSTKAPTDFLRTPDNGTMEIFREIHYFIENHSETKTIGDLYQTLQNEPFGLYSEVIPLYLVSALVEKKYSYSFYEEDQYKKDVNSDLFEKIHTDPYKFTIRILPKDTNIDTFLDFIIQTFEPPIKDKKNDNENKLYRATFCLLQFYIRLPDYTKKTKSLSRNSKQFLELISSSSAPDKLLLTDITQLFSIQLDTKDAIRFKNNLRVLAEMKKEIESNYTNLIDKIEKASIRCFYPYIRISSIFDGIESFKKKYSEQISLLATHNTSFKRFYERLCMPYNTTENILESLATLLVDQHPKYWKDDTIDQYVFQLTNELAKLYIANVMKDPEGIMVQKERIKLEFRQLDDKTKKDLLKELMEEIGSSVQ